MKNLMLKTRPIEKPYEIWVAPGFEWRVLKKYQTDDKKPQARWFLATKGPGTFGEFELGDGYAADIMRSGTRTYVDPTVAS